ncbi:MAG TPA: hypothetical protein VEJ18_20635 [Planctomycetota bacterium]|nr:hypothetical protein [Planctomycetota bacterium]
MTQTSLISNPGNALSLIRYEERLVLNKTGQTTVVGSLLQFDTFLTVATTFVEGSTSSGTPNSAYNVVVNPGLTGATNGSAPTFGLFCIALEAVADGKPLRVCVRGRVTAKVRAVTGGKSGYGCPIYGPFNAADVQRYVCTVQQNNLKVLGWIEGNYTLTSPDAAATAEASYTAGALADWPVLFNGIEGMA